DSVMGLSTLQYLKSLYPDTHLIYTLPRWITPLYENVETAADEILPLEWKTAGDWWKSYRQLKEKNINTVLELFQSGRTAKFFSLWEKLGGPKYYFHNHHEKGGPVHDQGVIKSNIQRDLDGAWTFFSKSNQPPSFLEFPPIMKLKGQKKIELKNQIILGIVATRETKMWPLDYYGKLTHLLKEKYPQNKIVIPLGPGDQRIKDEIQKSMHPECEFLQGPLSELPLTLSGSKQYIGNDTGLKHICVALGVPTFTLFGPEPPTEWHPYSLENHPLYFREPLECRTRVAHYCGLSTCDSMICLNEFKPENLLEKIQLV
ncbi:MAG: hypothetical protein NXH75_08790, partial [Halobacteriovoraceae bacterium]|nr:hypothetical protein [Halobacteriovoraceae bacterium]